LSEEFLRIPLRAKRATADLSRHSLATADEPAFSKILSLRLTATDCDGTGFSTAIGTYASHGAGDFAVASFHGWMGVCCWPVISVFQFFIMASMSHSLDYTIA
jgi:hypothetical protein